MAYLAAQDILVLYSLYIVLYVYYAVSVRGLGIL